MEVILIERHSRLGDIGSIVKVKNGYARNYLLPNKKAIRAHEDNKKIFESQRAEIEKEFNAKREAAEVIKNAIDSKTVILVKQAGKDDRMYGSVTSNDIVTAIKEQLSQDLSKSCVKLLTQIKFLGSYIIPINIFSDIHSNIEILIARSKDEAEQELKKRSFKAEVKAQEELEIKTPISSRMDDEEALGSPTKNKAASKAKSKTLTPDSTTKSTAKRNKRV